MPSDRPNVVAIDEALARSIGLTDEVRKSWLEAFTLAWAGEVHDVPEDEQE